MKPRFWFVLAAIAGSLALLLGLTTAFSTGTSPRSHVEHTYTRAAHLDPEGRNNARAYTSPDQPTAVAAEISDKWRPQNRIADASGIYLRYSDDAVVVRPHDGGSLILVMNARQAYHMFPTVIGGAWGWSSPHGESFRGRGPGVGK